MTVSTTARGKFTIVAILGESKLDTISELKSALDAVFAQAPEAVIIDMTETPYIDSSSIAVLLDFNKKLKASETSLTLAGLTPEVSRLFKITQLTNLFTIVGSVDEAMGA